MASRVGPIPSVGSFQSAHPNQSMETGHHIVVRHHNFDLKSATPADAAAFSFVKSSNPRNLSLVEVIHD